MLQSWTLDEVTVSLRRASIWAAPDGAALFFLCFFSARLAARVDPRNGVATRFHTGKQQSVLFEAVSGLHRAVPGLDGVRCCFVRFRAPWLHRVFAPLILPLGARPATTCARLPPARSLAIASGHTTLNTPDLFRTPKLTSVGPGQYWGGGPPGKTLGCC